MSYEADMRDNLERVAAMMPLTERERTLAAMMLRVGDGFSLESGDCNWFGEKAVSAYEHLTGESVL